MKDMMYGKLRASSTGSRLENITEKQSHADGEHVKVALHEL